MKTGGALLIIAVGLIALWIVVTGRLTQLQTAWNTLNGQPTSVTSGSSSGGSITVPGVPFSIPIPGIGTLPTSYGVSPLPVPTIALG